MIEEKYKSFVQSNLEPCYYETAEEMMLLHPVEELLKKWDNKNGMPVKVNEIKESYITPKHLKNYIAKLEERNEGLFKKLQLLDKFISQDYKINFKKDSLNLIQIRHVIENYFKRNTTWCTRKREIVYARQMGMYFSSKLTDETLANIGFEFGGKDHATVLHSRKTIENLSIYPKTKKHIAELNFIFNAMIEGKESDSESINKIWSY